MLGFRYHALSLVAVLFALTVGLLLGVAIGDKNLVSSAENDLRGSLREEVHARDKTIDSLNAEIAARDDFAAQAYPLLVGGQLSDQNIALIFLGKSDSKITSLVRKALADTGGSLALEAVVREPPDLAGLSERALATRYTDLVNDPSLLSPFGTRMGVQLVSGGALIRSERPAFFRSSTGALVVPMNGIVVVRSPMEGLSKNESKQVDELETGFMKGLLKDDLANVVGVETSGTKPSQVSWYRDHGASSVDNLDDVAGQAALVFALAGSDGAFGTGPGETLIPPVVGGSQPAKTPTTATTTKTEKQTAGKTTTG